MKHLHARYDPQELLDDVSRVIQESGGDVSNTAYREYGRYSSSTVTRHFGGSWKGVLAQLGITPEVAAEMKRRRRLASSSISLSMPGTKKAAEPVQRLCLWCDQEFPSFGPENRICQHCKERDLWKSPIETVTIEEIPISKDFFVI